MSAQYNKIHFEILTESSLLVHSQIGFPPLPFYEFIDGLHKELKEKYTAFPYDKACSLYIETIFDKIKDRMGNSGNDVNGMRSRFWDTYLPYMFYKSGKKVFRPTPELIHMLVDTEINNINTYFVQCPFKCIYISIPKEVKLMNPFNLPVDGLYIAVFNKEEIHYDGFSPDYREFENYEGSKNLVVCAISDTVLAHSDPRETMYYWNIALKEGDLFEQIKGLLDRYDADYQNQKYKSVNKEYNRMFLENIISFAINTLLYINSKEPNELKLERPKQANIENKKNKAKIRAAFRKTQIPYYTIGQNITIDHSYKSVIKMYDRTEAGQRKLVGQWVVRGHWRNQAHGKRFSERKVIWIQPYVKGDEFSEVIEKGYVVK